MLYLYVVHGMVYMKIQLVSPAMYRLDPILLSLQCPPPWANKIQQGLAQTNATTRWNQEMANDPDEQVRLALAAAWHFSLHTAVMYFDTGRYIS